MKKWCLLHIISNKWLSGPPNSHLSSLTSFLFTSESIKPNKIFQLSWSVICRHVIINQVGFNNTLNSTSFNYDLGLLTMYLMHFKPFSIFTQYIVTKMQKRVQSMCLQNVTGTNTQNDSFPVSNKKLFIRIALKL